MMETAIKVALRLASGAGEALELKSFSVDEDGVEALLADGDEEFVLQLHRRVPPKGIAP